MKALVNPAAWAAVLLLPAVACVAAQEAGLDPGETCKGRADGAACWQQLDTHPGCHVWNASRRAGGQTASWTGQCNGAVAEGEGVLTWADPEGPAVYKGALVGGKLHGRVSEVYGDGIRVGEGTYARGQRVGRWRFAYFAGSENEGTYANGRLTGRWVLRDGDGNVIRETPYVNGEIHGTAVWRYANGHVGEVPWVNGKRHGTEVWRYADGHVYRETPWVEGQKHGTEVLRYKGHVIEVARYINGEEQPDP